jgi:hypothetical protein
MVTPSIVAEEESLLPSSPSSTLQPATPTVPMTTLPLPRSLLSMPSTSPRLPSADPWLINSPNASLWLPPPQQTQTSPGHCTPTTWVSQPMQLAILICLAIPMTSHSPAFLHCQHSPKPQRECQAVSPPPSSVTTTLVGSIRDNELLTG